MSAKFGGEFRASFYVNLGALWKMCADVKCVFNFAKKIVSKYFSLKYLASCTQDAGFYIRPITLRDFDVLYMCVYAWSPVDRECGISVFCCRNGLR